MGSSRRQNGWKISDLFEKRCVPTNWTCLSLFRCHGRLRTHKRKDVSTVHPWFSGLLGVADILLVAPSSIAPYQSISSIIYVIDGAQQVWCALKIPFEYSGIYCISWSHAKPADHLPAVPAWWVGCCWHRSETEMAGGNAPLVLNPSTARVFTSNWHCY